MMRLLACLVLASCATTQLEIDKEHPAFAAAATPAVTPVGSALAAEYEPVSASAAETGDARKPPEPTLSPNDSAALWTCPMHPQVVQKKPGNCPICGMKLKPVTSKGSEDGAER
jgi:hypothetical protein